MRSSYLQTSFLSGEWSPFYQGRADKKGYKSAMNVCRNSFPLEEGTWVRRPGFRMLTPAAFGADTSQSRVYPVAFTEDQPIDVVFQDGVLAFLYGNAPLLTPGLPAITSISTDNPAILTLTANTYNWAAGDTVVFLFDSTVPGIYGAPIRGCRLLRLGTPSGAAFPLTDAFTGATLDGSTLNLSGVSGISVGRLAIVASPFTAGTWANCRVVQNQDFALILGNSEPTQVLTIQNFTLVETAYGWLAPGFPIATADVSLTPLTMLDGPYLDPVVDSSGTPSVLNWTGGTVTGPAIVAGDGSYAGGAATGTIVAVKQPLTPTVTSAQYAFFSYSAILPANLGGGGMAATAPAGYISDYNGWVPVDPTGVASQATGVFTITAGFQAWRTGQYYLPNNCVSIGTQAYKCILANVGTTPPNATYWTAIDSGYAVTGLADTTVGFQATDVGRMVRLLSAPADYDPTVVYGIGSLVTYGGQAYAMTVSGRRISYGADPSGCLAGAAAITPTTFSAPEWGSNIITAWDNSQTGTPDLNGTTSSLVLGWCPAVNAFNWVWGRITSVTSTSVAVVTLDPGSAPMLEPLNKFQINTWRMGAFADGSWPASGTFYEDRFWFGGSIKNRFDTSQSHGWIPGNTVLNMAPTVTTGDLQAGYSNDGTVTDACGISYILESKEANDIFWFAPDKGGLLAGTINGEWMIAASQLSDPITPTSIQAKEVTHYGCANIEPRKTGMGLVFIQKFLHRVMEFLPQVFVGGFIAPHLNEAAKHLSTKTLVEMAYQEELAPLLWFRTGVGNLVGALYRRVSAFLTDDTTIIGWHHHDLAPWITGGLALTSLGVNSTPDGTLDALTVTVDDIHGNTWVEKTTQIFDEDDVLSDAFFLDHAKVPDTIFETTYNGVLGVQLTGLWYQTGVATITIAGLDCGDFDLDTQGPYSTVFVPYGSGVAPASIDYTSPGAGAYLLTRAFLDANASAIISRNGGAMWQTGTAGTTTTVTTVTNTTTTASIQSFVPVTSLDSNVDTQATNALIDWTDNILMIPAHSTSGIREFGAVSGVETHAKLTDTILTLSGSVWGNDIGAIRAGKMFFEPALGNYEPLVRIDNAALTKDYLYGAYSSTGPPTNPGAVYPESMAISSDGAYVLVVGASFEVTLHQASNGAYVAGNTPDWRLSATGGCVAPDANGNFYIAGSDGALYKVTPSGPSFNKLVTIPATAIDPTWNNGGGTFSGLVVDPADGGLIFFAKGNFSGLSAWASGTTYAAGAMIYDASVVIYTSKVAGNIGNTPSTSPADWNQTTLQYLVKFTGTFPSKVWALPITFMPNGTNDLLAQSAIVAGAFSFLEPIPKVGFPSYAGSGGFPTGGTQITTIDTLTGALVSAVPIAGVTLESAGQAYDAVSNSIVFNGDFNSVLATAVTPLNSTVTCSATWLRLYVGGTTTATTVVTTSTGTYTPAGYLPAVVGYTYTSQGQTLRPISPEDTGAKAGPGFEKTRRSHLIGMLLHNTIGLEFGTSFASGQLQPAILKNGQDGNTGTQLPPNLMFSGHYRKTLIDDYSYDSMLAWQITRPYPAAVVNVGAFIETQDV